MRSDAITATQGVVMVQVGKLVFPATVQDWQPGVVTFILPTLTLTEATDADIVAVDNDGNVLAGQTLQLIAAPVDSTATSVAADFTATDATATDVSNMDPTAAAEAAIGE